MITLPLFISKTIQHVHEMLQAHTYLLSPIQQRNLFLNLKQSMNPNNQDTDLIKTDIDFILEKDPALANKEPVEVFLYKSLPLTFLHRIAHRIYKQGDTTSARLLSEVTREITGAEIHPGVSIGHSIFIDHPVGLIAGESTSIGNRFHGHGQVILGSDGINNGNKRHPTIGNNVTIWPKAAILGAKTIGDNVIIGASAVITEDVPSNSVIVGYNLLIKENGIDKRIDLKQYHQEHFVWTQNQFIATQSKSA